MLLTSSCMLLTSNQTSETYIHTYILYVRTYVCMYVCMYVWYICMAACACALKFLNLFTFCHFSVALTNVFPSYSHRHTCTNVPAKKLINKLQFWTPLDDVRDSLSKFGNVGQTPKTVQCRLQSDIPTGHAENSCVYCTTQLIPNDPLSNHVRPTLISQSSKSFHCHEHPLLSCDPCRQSIRAPRMSQFPSIQPAKCLALTAIC